jgi:hypothetical protein
MVIWVHVLGGWILDTGCWMWRLCSEAGYAVKNRHQVVGMAGYGSAADTTLVQRCGAAGVAGCEGFADTTPSAWLDAKALPTLSSGCVWIQNGCLPSCIRRANSLVAIITTLFPSNTPQSARHWWRRPCAGCR